MTTRDPALIWRPLAEADEQPFITPTQWIAHTAVDGPGPTNLGNYFESRTVTLESHTWLRWASHEQFIPFDRSADANYKVNRYLKNGKWVGAISTETEDDGSPEQNPWNAYQVNELIRFGVWLNRTFGIPPHLPTAWDAPGMGYHSLFPGVWTNVRGKTCPGATRIRQWNNEVLPRIRAILNGEEDDMKDDERQWLKTLHDVFAGPQPSNGPGTEPRVNQVLDNALWTKNRLADVKRTADEAKAEARAAALAATGNNQLLYRIIEHLGIDDPSPPAA